MAEAIAAARLGQQIGRVRHALHAAGDDDRRRGRPRSGRRPIITAFMPEPHTLLIVVPARRTEGRHRRAAWRAGAWPRPAGSTQPIRVSSMSPGVMPARLTASPIAAAPSSGAAASGKLALKAAHRRAGAGKNYDFRCCHGA